MNQRIKQIEDNLIEVFANHCIAAIESDTSILLKKFREKKYNTLLEKEGFVKVFTKIKTVKDILEELQKDYESDWEKTLESLVLMRRMRLQNEENAKILNKLILGGIYNDWEDELKEHYDRLAKMILQWKHFFLSYTNRNHIETNADFKDILIDVYGNQYYKMKESGNLVAKLLARYFSDNNISCFYDKDDIVCGDDWKDKIFIHCQTAFTFIQLIENKSFVLSKKEPNWCFEEYLKFLESIQLQQLVSGIKNKLYFFSTFPADDVIPSHQGKYQDWISQFKAKQVIVIDGLKRKELKIQIKKAAYQIIEARKNTLDEVLNDFKILVNRSESSIGSKRTKGFFS